MYPIEKYQIYKHTNKDGVKEIIAVSTYAGKCVRGVAKCDPRDEYNEEIGAALAVGRCAARISEKRRCRADKMLNEAQAKVQEAKRHEVKMGNYYSDAVKQEKEAKEWLANLEKEFNL